MRQVAVVPLLIAVLAGCAAPEAGRDDTVMLPSDPFFGNATYDPALFDIRDLSQAVHDILPVEEVLVTMSDGLRMHNAVYRPDTDEPVPVFINFSPYWGDTATEKGDAFGHYMVDQFVPRGYAVVLAAVRGTGHSEGCFEVASDREAMDVREVVDHFAQEPWSNGNVAAGGKSYDSTTQNGMIAKFPSPHLKGIFHVSGITDMYRYTFYNGLPTRATSGAWTAQYSTGYGVTEAGQADQESLTRLVTSAGCQENVETLTMPGAAHATGAKNPYWIERDWTRSIGSTSWNGSIFFYHGFHDWNVQPAHILPWLDNVPEQVRVKAWLHQDREQSGHVYPMRTDWNLTMLRWLDAELKGIDTGFWDEPRAQLQGSDRLWREQATWPDRSAMQTLQVGTDGLLLEATDTAWRYSGAPTITATATPLTPDPVFSAKLYDVAPDGTQELRNEAVMRLVYRNSLDAPSPVVPGQPFTFTVPFYASDDVLEPGHRWTVVFQEEPAHSIATPAQMAGLEVHDAAVGIAIVDAQQGLLEVQPTPMACFAC